MFSLFGKITLKKINIYAIKPEGKINKTQINLLSRAVWKWRRCSCNSSLPPHSHICFLVSLRLRNAFSPTCPRGAILQLKGGRAGKVVKCQAANPSWNEGRFTWSLPNRRECPRNKMFKKPLKLQLTPALGSSECSWSVGTRKESSSSIQKQSRVTTWWGLSSFRERLLSCWEGGGKEARLRRWWCPGRAACCSSQRRLSQLCQPCVPALQSLV